MGAATRDPLHMVKKWKKSLIAFSFFSFSVRFLPILGFEYTKVKKSQRCPLKLMCNSTVGGARPGAPTGNGGGSFGRCSMLESSCFPQDRPQETSPCPHQGLVTSLGADPQGACVLSHRG